MRICALEEWLGEHKQGLVGRQGVVAPQRAVVAPQRAVVAPQRAVVAPQEVGQPALVLRR